MAKAKKSKRKAKTVLPATRYSLPMPPVLSPVDWMGYIDSDTFLEQYILRALTRITIRITELEHDRKDLVKRLERIRSAKAPKRKGTNAAK